MKDYPIIILPNGLNVRSRYRDKEAFDIDDLRIYDNRKVVLDNETIEVVLEKTEGEEVSFMGKKHQMTDVTLRPLLPHYFTRRYENPAKIEMFRFRGYIQDTKVSGVLKAQKGNYNITFDYLERYDQKLISRFSGLAEIFNNEPRFSKELREIASGDRVVLPLATWEEIKRTTQAGLMVDYDDSDTLNLPTY